MDSMEIPLMSHRFYLFERTCIYGIYTFQNKNIKYNNTKVNSFTFIDMYPTNIFLNIYYIYSRTNIFS